MNTDRRGFIKTAGLGLTALGLFGANARSSDSSDSFKIGMCDWNVRNQKGESGTCRPDFIPIAAEAHLKGIQVSVGYLDQRNNDTVVPLRIPPFAMNTLNWVKNTEFNSTPSRRGASVTALRLDMNRNQRFTSLTRWKPRPP